MAKKKATKKKVTKKQAARKTAARKTAAKKVAAKKTATRKTAAKKAAAKKGPVRKQAAEKAAPKAVSGKAGGRVRVTLVRSPASTPQRHRLWVRGLGLRRMHQSVEIEDTPANRGMINRAAYLLRVEKLA